MALLEYVSPDVDDERLQELFAADAETYGRPSLFARMLAHESDVLEARQRYVSRLVETGSLDTTLTELVYVAVAGANDCEYCVASHTERLVEHVGLQRETIDAVLTGEHDAFDDRERAVVEFARAVASDPKRVSGSDVESLGAVGFDDGDVVELVVVASAAVAANVVADALSILPQDSEGLDGYVR